MLVAAKILAQDAKLDAAVACTREVRSLAARQSALPCGSSGVPSVVTHEAFKLEVTVTLLAPLLNYAYSALLTFSSTSNAVGSFCWAEVDQHNPPPPPPTLH